MHLVRESSSDETSLPAFLYFPSDVRGVTDYPEEKRFNNPDRVEAFEYRYAVVMQDVDPIRHLLQQDQTVCDALEEVLRFLTTFSFSCPVLAWYTARTRFDTKGILIHLKLQHKRQLGLLNSFWYPFQTTHWPASEYIHLMAIPPDETDLPQS